MSYYTVFIGGGHRDRTDTDEDISNVNKVLSLDTSGGCYTKLFKDDIFIAQIEHVLDGLVSISYIDGEENLNSVIDMVKETGITAYSITFHGDDKECLTEVSFMEKSL